MSKNRLQSARNEIQNWLERCLIGPFAKTSDSSTDNNEEKLHTRPSDIYQCGILYGHLPDESIELSGNDTENSDDPGGASTDGIDDQIGSSPFYLIIS